MNATEIKHADAKCVRVNRTEHYSNKNWSMLFECPTCKRTGRFSLNFLGRKIVMCNGVKFTRELRGDL